MIALNHHPDGRIEITSTDNLANNLMITENYTSRVRKAEYTALVPEQRLSDLEYNLRQLSYSNLKLRNENTIMAARILHLELMLTDKEYRKKFKKQNTSK